MSSSTALGAEKAIISISDDTRRNDSENDKGQRNLHIHVLLTMRPLTEKGECHTADSTDWNSQENAKMWRKDLADTINATNEQLGIMLHWEHRSFKEQGIDREPTI